MTSGDTKSGGLRPTRRTVVKGAAWAVPVVVAATAAPAAAQSACTPSTVFNSLPVGQCVTNLTFAPSTVTGTLTYASWGQPSSKPGDTCRVAQVSGPNGWRYVELEMVSSLNKGDYVELTISLSQPVDDLSFVLHDIDKVRGGWDDTVQVMTPGYTYVLGSNIQGTGTSDQPFRAREWGDTPITSGQGTVRLTWAGPVSTVTIRYLAGITGSSTNQHIGLGDIRFNACVEPRLAPRTIGPASRVQQSAVVFSESDGSFDS